MFAFALEGPVPGIAAAAVRATALRPRGLMVLPGRWWAGERSSVTRGRWLCSAGGSGGPQFADLHAFSR